MQRAVLLSIVLAGAAASAVLAPGLLARGRGPAVPAAAAAAAATMIPAAAPSDPSSLRAMLEAGRRARRQRAEPAPPSERRRTIEASLDRGTADARRAALRGLALADRPLAEELARPRVTDPVLFAEAARVLLSAGGTVDAADLARVRRELLTGGHDEAGRTAVSVLVLETLVRLDSPATSRFVASLADSPSPRLRAVAARFSPARPARAAAPTMTRGPATRR